MTDPSPLPSSESSRVVRPVEDRHLWEIAWVRDLLWIAGFTGLFTLMIMARSILVPVCVALALAYIFNPLITWMQRRWGWPRWAGVAAVFAVVLVAATVVAFLTVPPLVHQTRQLARKTPSYLREAADPLHVDYRAWQEKATGLFGKITTDATHTAEPMLEAPADAASPSMPKDETAQVSDIPWASIGQILLRGVGFGFDVVSGVLGFITYLILFMFITAFCFFFFCWHFQGVIDWFEQFVPLSTYDRTTDIARKMDRTLSAFIRGRLVQSLVFGAVLSIGWWIAGVPYWLLLGMGCGLLNLIPYAAFIGWPLSIVLTWADQLGGGAASQSMSLMAIVVWPSVVYFIGQALDGWVVEPLVQGKATALDPLSVLLAVMIGATLAGVLGMLLAIPVAACGKIFAQEVIIPKLRSRAQVVKV